MISVVFKNVGATKASSYCRPTSAFCLVRADLSVCLLSPTLGPSPAIEVEINESCFSLQVTQLGATARVPHVKPATLCQHAQHSASLPASRSHHAAFAGGAACSSGRRSGTTPSTCCGSSRPLLSSPVPRRPSPRASQPEETQPLLGRLEEPVAPTRGAHSAVGDRAPAPEITNRTQRPRRWGRFTGGTPPRAHFFPGLSRRKDLTDSRNTGSTCGGAPAARARQVPAAGGQQAQRHTQPGVLPRSPSRRRASSHTTSFADVLNV